MHYTITPSSKPPAFTDAWDQGVWQNANELELKNHIRERPEHFPRVRAKLLYDDEALHVYFRVDDRYVRAVAKNYHDNVCWDSCVEFFFTPGPDVAAGYFNVEINCKGVILCRHQPVPWENQVPLTLEDCQQVKIWPSLGAGTVEPEIAEAVTWEIKCSLPYDVLSRYAPVAKPAPGVVWRGNFYKCADETSHPHWITWAPVPKEDSTFHMPEHFGTLDFSGA